MAGLGPGGSATVSFRADRTALVVHADRRCDAVAVGQARCRVSGGRATLVFRARPRPDARTTLRFTVAPNGGTPNARPGNETDTVTLIGRLRG